MSLENDPRHFSSLAVELGFATEAQVAEAVALRSELLENGVTAHVSDLLIDAGAITLHECQQIELQQEMQLVLFSLGKQQTSRNEGAWLVAAMTPLIAFATFYGVLACAAALAIGAFVAWFFPLRWVALGWIASVAVPGVSLPSVAASGVLAAKKKHQLFAALAVAASSGFVFVNIAFTPGLLFMGAGLALAISRLRK